MESAGFGIEQLTQEDRDYQGSRYAEVRDALFANRYQKIWGGEGEQSLPMQKVTLGNVLNGIFPPGKNYRFLQASKRAVDARSDLRWGPDGKGYRRLLHPNGVCLTGLWRITEENVYSGYFKRGSEALLIGRYSTCCGETRRGHSRSLSLVGKLFPTTDPNHRDLLRTANFITQQDIGGDYTDYINDAETRNAPDTTLWRRGTGFPILLITGAIFLFADKQATIRQLYEIAELGQPENLPPRTPQFMRLIVAPEQPRIHGQNLDFRDEIMAQIYDRGNPTPKRTLKFLIEVTDEGSTKGLLSYQRRTFTNWRRIGEIIFDDAVVSFNGDRVIHFNHPTWREDRNDPATATRVNGRKVRW
jgi:hypothetical protein